MLQRIATGPELSKDLSLEETRLGIRLILQGKVDPVQAGVFLIALRMKRETDDENRGALEAIREATQAVAVDVDDLLDIADPYDGFNRHLLVSPFLPSVLAACGLPAFSHGVESVGPKHGATHHQVLRAAGIAVDDTPERAAARVRDPDIGWAYVDQRAFCPSLHGLVGLRALIVKRPVITTVEVMAGALRARARTHLMTGYVHKPYPRKYAVLARCAGYDSALLVRGVEGGVTPSLRQSGKIWFYHDGGEEQSLDLEPEALGIVQEARAVPLPEVLAGYSKAGEGAGAVIDPGAMAAAAAEVGVAALRGEPGPARDSLVYAAALALFHVGRQQSLPDAADAARRAIDTGKAAAHFDAAR